MVFIVDSAGEFEYANHAFETVTGYSAREVSGHNLSLVIADVTQFEAYHRLREEALLRGIYRGALSVRCRNGSVCELDVAITAVRDRTSRSTSLVCTARDLVAQRDLVVETSHARRVDAIGTLAGGVAHDFNNLLMVIGAYAELVLLAMTAEDPLRGHLQQILAASRRASDLTRQLLVVGHPNVPGMHLLSVNSIVEETCGLIPKLLREDIELEVILGRGLGQIKPDSGQIEQVLLNLAVNARDAMPKGGKLKIETRAVHLKRSNGDAAVRSGDYVLLTFTDSGEGIAPAELSRIFQPFYTTKPPGKGTGLGLAMVESIVKESGGFILVESKLGEGSIFKLHLPVSGRPKKQVVSSPARETQAVGGSETLLLVEDEDPLREATAEFLRSIGYKVSSARNGEEALENLRAGSGKFDLLVSDVVMPHMSGPRLAEITASRWPQVKMLFLSGYGESVVLQKGLLDMNEHFLQKPFPMPLLAAKIREVLGAPVALRAAAAAAAG